MIEIDLDEMLAASQARKVELGLVEDEAHTERLRNKGGQRTPEKRELLQRAKTRAVAAGLKPSKAYF